MDKKKIIIASAVIPSAILGYDIVIAEASETNQNSQINNIVHIEDKTLELAIKKILLIGYNQEITKEHMEKIVELELSTYKVTSLEGLQYATNLKTLSMYNQNIEDLSVLGQLLSVESLTITGSKLTSEDLSPIVNLVQLKELNLNSNEITSLEDFRQLTNLKTLQLASNKISDVSPLSELVGLTKLNLGDNYIEDVTSLAVLPSLTALQLSYNFLTHIPQFNGTSNVQVAGNLISNRNNISKYQNLFRSYSANEGNLVSITTDTNSYLSRPSKIYVDTHINYREVQFDSTQKDDFTFSLSIPAFDDSQYFSSYVGAMFVPRNRVNNYHAKKVLEYYGGEIKVTSKYGGISNINLQNLNYYLNLPNNIDELSTKYRFDYIAPKSSDFNNTSIVDEITFEIEGSEFKTVQPLTIHPNTNLGGNPTDDVVQGLRKEDADNFILDIGTSASYEFSVLDENSDVVYVTQTNKGSVTIPKTVVESYIDGGNLTLRYSVQDIANGSDATNYTKTFNLEVISFEDSEVERFLLDSLGKDSNEKIYVYDIFNVRTINMLYSLEFTDEYDFENLLEILKLEDYLGGAMLGTVTIVSGDITYAEQLAEFIKTRPMLMSFVFKNSNLAIDGEEMSKVFKELINTQVIAYMSIRNVSSEKEVLILGKDIPQTNSLEMLDIKNLNKLEYGFRTILRDMFSGYGYSEEQIDLLMLQYEASGQYFYTSSMIDMVGIYNLTLDDKIDINFRARYTYNKVGKKLLDNGDVELTYTNFTQMYPFTLDNPPTISLMSQYESMAFTNALLQTGGDDYQTLVDEYDSVLAQYNELNSHIASQLNFSRHTEPFKVIIPKSIITLAERYKDKLGITDGLSFNIANKGSNLELNYDYIGDGKIVPTIIANSYLKETRIAKGEVDINYFTTNKEDTEILDNFTPKQLDGNGKYTLYVKDVYGNEKIRVIEIADVFVEAPFVLATKLFPVNMEVLNYGGDKSLYIFNEETEEWEKQTSKYLSQTSNGLVKMKFGKVFDDVEMFSQIVTVDISGKDENNRFAEANITISYDQNYTPSRDVDVVVENKKLLVKEYELLYDKDLGENSRYVYFEDKKLQGHLNYTYYGIVGASAFTEPILKSDLLKITEINLNGLKLDSLVGMEHMKNLSSLTLSNNNISDLTPLKDLESLYELSIVEDSLFDITNSKNLDVISNMNLVFLTLVDNKGTKNTEFTLESDTLGSLNIVDSKINSISNINDIPNLKIISLPFDYNFNTVNLSKFDAVYGLSDYIDSNGDNHIKYKDLINDIPYTESYLETYLNSSATMPDGYYVYPVYPNGGESDKGRIAIDFDLEYLPEIYSTEEYAHFVIRKENVDSFKSKASTGLYTLEYSLVYTDERDNLIYKNPRAILSNNDVLNSVDFTAIGDRYWESVGNINNSALSKYFVTYEDFLSPIYVDYNGILNKGNWIKLEPNSPDRLFTIDRVNPRLSVYTKPNGQIYVEGYDRESGLKNIFVAKGLKDERYFKNEDNYFESVKSFTKYALNSDGEYTFYAEDFEGNSVIKVITINGLNLESPKVNYSTKRPINTNVTVTVEPNSDSDAVLMVYDDDLKEWVSADSPIFTFTENGQKVVKYQKTNQDGVTFYSEPTLITVNNIDKENLDIVLLSTETIKVDELAKLYSQIPDLQTIYYSLDGDNYTEYLQGLTLPIGTHKLYLYSQDLAGNNSEIVELSITVTDDETLIGSVNVIHEDMEGNILEEKLIADIEFSNSYTHTEQPKVFADYLVLDSEPNEKSVVLDKDNLNQTITFKYDLTELDGLVTVNYVTKDGELLSTKLVEDIVFKKDYLHEETAIKIDGYELIDDETKSVTLNRLNPQQTITFTYDDEYTEGNVLVYYVDKNGTVLESKLVEEVAFDVEHTERAITIRGYELADDEEKSVTLTKDEPNQTITFVYDVEILVGTVLVNYVDEDDKVIESKLVSDVEFGVEHKEVYKTLLGYTLNDDEEKSVTLTKANQNQTITFKYKKDIILGSLLVKYVDENGDVLDSKLLENLSINTSYTENAKVISGYLLNDVITKTITLDEENKDGELVFNYKKVVTTEPTNPEYCTDDGGNLVLDKDGKPIIKVEEEDCDVDDTPTTPIEPPVDEPPVVEPPKEPTPSNPTPSNPTPSNPIPSNPTPSVPTPSNPVPSVPNPTPIIDEPIDEVVPPKEDIPQSNTESESYVGGIGLLLLSIVTFGLYRRKRKAIK